jgi:hypothetical protein
VSENRALTKIFGPKREEVAGDWRRLHNGELRNLYSSPYITKMFKPGRMRWVWNVAHMGETRNSYSIIVRKPDQSKDKGVDGMKILK